MRGMELEKKTETDGLQAKKSLGTIIINFRLDKNVISSYDFIRIFSTSCFVCQ